MIEAKHVSLAQQDDGSLDQGRGLADQLTIHRARRIRPGNQRDVIVFIDNAAVADFYIWTWE